MSTPLDPEQLAAELHDARQANHDLCKEVRLMLSLLCYPEPNSPYHQAKRLVERVDALHTAVTCAEAS